MNQEPANQEYLNQEALNQESLNQKFVNQESANQEKFWNSRYQTVGADYLFGTSPSQFLARRLALFKQGETVLSVADGECRNSVWLAQQGLAVTAIEISALAVQKAQLLASSCLVEVTRIEADMLSPDWATSIVPPQFDWVMGIFIQFAGAELRAQ
jgi:2-polyprenyl-3-methyl-5-hydroxy-6-metoxy-1,4-benzoquinol methylase